MGAAGVEDGVLTLFDEYERKTTVEKPCTCGSHRVGIVVGPFGPHYGKQVCLSCGTFRGWEQKPPMARGAQNGRPGS